MNEQMEHAGNPALVARTLRMIAEKNFPAGGIARCKICGKSNPVTVERIIEFMRNGFPIHCNLEITLDERKTR